MLHRITSLLLLFVFALCCSASPVPAAANVTDVAITGRGGYGGRGTWYYPGLDACGATDAADSAVVAVSMALYYSNNGGYCGKWVAISYNGKTAYAQIHDACESCGYYDLDMGPSVFQQLAGLDVGELQVTWDYI